jgi:hypothetical protein
MHVYGGMDEAIDIHDVNTELIPDDTLTTLSKEPWILITDENQDTYTCLPRHGEEFTLKKSAWKSLRDEYEYSTEHELTRHDASKQLLQIGKDLVADIGRTGVSTATVEYTEQHISELYAALLIIESSNK